MIDQNFRKQVREAILKNQENFPSMSDSKYAKMIGLNPAIFSRLKNGETEKLAGDNFWIEQGNKLGVNPNKKELKLARTAVYEQFLETITFCKNYSKSTIVIDECGVGKTRCTQHIVRGLQNAFYLDCSQAKTKTEFIRHLAKTIGLDNTGRIADIKSNIKYYLNLMDKPFIALDDAGYLETKVFIEIIEIWNATDKQCAWMMIGDDSLQLKLVKGLNSKKLGFRALFSRFSDECVHFVPTGSQRTEFMQQLIGDVASVNLSSQAEVNKMIALCVSKGKTLRHLETLIDLKSMTA